MRFNKREEAVITPDALIGIVLTIGVDRVCKLRGLVQDIEVRDVVF